LGDIFEGFVDMSDEIEVCIGVLLYFFVSLALLVHFICGYFRCNAVYRMSSLDNGVYEAVPLHFVDDSVSDALFILTTSIFFWMTS
jgi:hypothetical protein